MAKIIPTTFLPYTKTTIRANTDKRADDTSDALSTKKPLQAPSMAPYLGVVLSAAAYREYIRLPKTSTSPPAPQPPPNIQAVTPTAHGAPFPTQVITVSVPTPSSPQQTNLPTESHLTSLKNAWKNRKN